MKIRMWSLLAVALLSLLFGQAATAAQARWEDILRGAEKEGEVSVHATNSVGDLKVLWAAFRERFPKIKLNPLGISTTSAMVTKVMAERRATSRMLITSKSAVTTGWSGSR